MPNSRFQSSSSTALLLSPKITSGRRVDSSGRRLLVRSLAWLAFGIFVGGVFASPAQAQRWRVRRPSAVVPVPIPLPGYYAGDPYGPWASPFPPGPFPPGPPLGGVRVRTPFFSLNVGPAPAAPIMPPRERYRDEPYSNSYGYGSSRYGSRRYGSRRPASPTLVNPIPAEEDLYAPGAEGGIPDVTSSAPSFDPSAFGDPADQPTAESSPARLRLAALELHESLLTFGRDAKVWLDYLRPDAIIAAVETGSVSEELFELTRRYDGVLMNPELRRVSTAPGFARTRQYLKPWLEEMSGSGEMLTEPDSDESPVDDAAAVGRAAAVESPFDALPGEREPASADAGTPEPSGPSGEDPPADVEVLPAPVELDTPEGVLEL